MGPVRAVQEEKGICGLVAESKELGRYRSVAASSTWAGFLPHSSKAADLAWREWALGLGHG